MELHRASAPDVPAEQKATAELIKRIRKLRWVGMEDEADLLRTELACRGIAAADVVLAEPCDTD